MQQTQRTDPSPHRHFTRKLGAGAAVVLFLVAAAVAQSREPAMPGRDGGDGGDGGDEQRVAATGHFVFEDGGAARPEPINAEFRRLDGDRWKVVFDFPFNGQDHRWTAEFRGDLTGGAFRGEVTWPNGRRSRTWIVEGSTHDGLLEATHTERKRNGELQSTGRLTLRLR